MFHSIKAYPRCRFVSILSILVFCAMINTVNSQPCSDHFEWQWLNPSPQGNLLHDVTCADGIYFAVGDGGAILSNTTGTWRLMNSGVSANLLGVWAAAFNDVFAVGSNGTVVHWNGTTWITMTSGTGSYLRGIWGSSPDDIYAVGDGGTIIHYDGTYWAPRASGTTYRLNDVHGTSMINVIAVGDDGKAVQFNGSSWTPIHDFRTQNFYAVWVNSPTDAWVVGEEGIARRFNGVDWFSYSSGGRSNLRGLWGTGPSNIYAVGDDEDGIRVIRQWDGTQWLKVNEVPGRDLHGIWGHSETDMAAVGQLGSIVSYDGVEWMQHLESFIEANLYNIWVNSTNDIIVVGSGGLILRYNGSDWQQEPSGTTESLFGIWSNGITAYASGGDKTLLKYEGGVWTPLPEPYFPAISTVHCVWGFGSDDVYFGAGWNVIHWNGSSWNNITPPGIEDAVHDIWGQAPHLFCKIGSYDLWHYDGSNWTQYSQPTENPAKDVWGFAPDDVYVAGWRLWHFNGTNWTDLSGVLPHFMTDIWGPSPDRLVIVGRDASYLWNGSSMELISSPVTGYLHGVSGTADCSVFTVGDAGRLLYAGDSVIVSVETPQQPDKFMLMQNYPNPFNPNTAICFNLDRPDMVNLAVFDVNGRLIRTLISGNVAAGRGSIEWDGTNSQGNPVSSGIYFCRLKAGGKVLARKMVLLK